MKVVEYWEAVERINSSTPNDTPDSYRVLGKYVEKSHAQKLVNYENKKLFESLRKSPGYPATATEYYVRLARLELIENEPDIEFLEGRK